MTELSNGSASLDQEPFYLPVADEVELFTAAYNQRLPILLKAPQAAERRDS